MSAIVIDGRAMALSLRAELARKAAAFAARAGRPPSLAAVRVGDDPASAIYVRNKGVAARAAGFDSVEHHLPASSGQKNLMALVARLNADPRVDGILVQLPLPEGLDSSAVLIAVDPAKDVDGFHPLNVGRLAQGEAAPVPCTPQGCLIMLRHQLGDLTGREAVVVGRSGIVGRPMAALLVRENCTVTIAHSKTRDLPAVCRRGDILIAAAGRPELVRGDWIKPGATVIDVGISRLPAGIGKSRLVGDVCFAEAVEVAGAITPVPGGVGPMTIACLLANTLGAACRRTGIDEERLLAGRAGR
jgi:methylenetetrahydrofolate dehydrogenase (NADP+) / methenyltetrahydrofolate cyclohydrolase